MKVEVLSVFLVCVLASTTLEAQETLYLIPSPKQITYNEGVFELKGEIAVTLYFNDKEEEAFQFALLEEEAKRSTEVLLSLGEGTEKRVIVGIDGGGRAFTRLARQHDMLPDETLGEEGYRLLVSPNLVLVSANTTRGAFYGVQTLRQLFRTQRVVGSVPSLKIKDWPDLEIRGMMDDISRGPVPTKEYMRQQIERMAGMKINLLTYYTQDVVKTESHPSFAPPGGALDIEEWVELADYAKKFHIDLVGNFQSFGHFQNILKHPEYAHLGESGSLLSPAFEESYQLLSDIYHEMIPAFHSEYFHINSDETFDLGTGASKAMVDSLGKGVVYANHIKRIYDIITPMGKKIMMWGDIVLKHPEILELLPKDIIMVTWGYDDMDDYSHMINPFKEAGYSTLVSTGILNSWSVMPDFNVAKGNIEGFVAEAKKQEVLGMLNTIWDDGGFALFSKDWYGVAYAADQSWTSNPGDETYDARFNRVVYGGTNNGFSNTIRTLNELSFLKSTEKMNEDVLWDPLVPEVGESVLINTADWSEVLEITEAAEGYLEEFDPLMYEKDLEFIQHTIELYTYLAQGRLNIVESSKLYKEAVYIQSTEPVEARKLLVFAFEGVNETYEELFELKVENQYLWVNENRVYALNRVISKYEAQLQSLSELRETVLQTIYDFDKGKALPEAASVRLEITETEGWYFQGWLMIEPIPNPGGFEDPGVDHLEDMSGIAGTFPNVTEEFYYDGVKYRWRRVNTPYFAKVDLDELHGQNENVVMYAFAHIDIFEDRTVRAMLGSSDGVEVYVNGESVHKNYAKREFELDEDELFLPLKAGRNHLMVRITNTSGDWAFSFRLPDSEMRSTKNRYRIIE